MAFRKLGEFIKLVDIRNSEGNISNLLGVSISKEFMPSVANIIGTDLTKYKIISKGQFACSLMQVSRDGGIAISLYKNAESAIMSPAYFIFEVSNSQLNSDYLELIFNTSEFDRAATFYAVGGVRGTLTWNDFCKMKINVPDIAEQERVVKIYNVINNRIKILNALNKNLEEQAQTIFKHWFIDFEFPNEEGQPYKSSGGKMIWNEELQKEIPEGWKSGKLGDIAEIKMGQSPKGETYNQNCEGIIFFQGRSEFGFRFPTPKIYTTNPIKIAKKNDILMSVRAPVGDLNVAYEDSCIGRGLASIRSKCQCQSFILYTMFSLKNTLNLFNKEGTIFGSINMQDLNNISCNIPTIDLMNCFEKNICKFDKLIRDNQSEIFSLISMRDLLLPKLLS